MTIKRPLLAILLLPFLSSLSYANDQPSPNLSTPIDFSKFNPKQTLSKEQMRSDIDTYIFAITHIYGGYAFVPEKGAGAFIEYLRSMNLPQQECSLDFAKSIYDNLSLVPDNHFRIYAGTTGEVVGRPHVPRQGVGVGDNFGPCTCKEDTCNGRTCSIQDKTWELNYFDQAKTIPVLSIHSFPPPPPPNAPPSDPWRGYLETINQVLSNSKILVVDLRGNGGGTDEMGDRLVSHIMGLPEGETPSPYSKVSRVWSLEDLDMFKVYQKFGLDQEKAAGIDTTAQEEQYKKQNQELEDQIKSGQLPPHQIIKQPNYATPGAQAFHGKLYILFDRHTGSSGEAISDELRMIPGAVTLGENTYGAIQYGSTGLLQLPESNIVLQMGIQYLEYTDGIYREQVGIAPNISVPQGQDAMTFLATHILGH